MAGGGAVARQAVAAAESGPLRVDWAYGAAGADAPPARLAGFRRLSRPDAGAGGTPAINQAAAGESAARPCAGRSASTGEAEAAAESFSDAFR